MNFRLGLFSPRRLLSPTLHLFLILLSLSVPGAAAELGSIEGKVLTHQGAPAEGATVSIADLRRKTVTDKEGNFRFEQVPEGAYLLEAVSPRYGSAVIPVHVPASTPGAIEIRLDLAVHLEKISVTAGAYSQSATGLSQSVTVVDKQELQNDAQPTLGDTLAKQPGITSTGYSPGVSRPVIRGQSGSRVRVLENGTDTADVSNISDDHAVSTDILASDRVEIIRGSATLLYGGNAVGGVVNILDDRVPSELAEHPVTGALEARYGSNAGEAAGGADLSGSASQFGWHVGGVHRNSGDFDTPERKLDNSDLETTQGTGGASWIGKQGFAGLSFTRFKTNYGIPNPDDAVRIDMDQKRYDFRGQFDPEAGFLRNIKTTFSRGNYQHSELEDTGAVSVTFFNDSWEGRVELIQREMGRVQGALGVQVTNRDFKAVGDEAFVPPNVTKNRSFFAFEKIGAGSVDFEIGARYENQDNTVDDPLLPARSFNGLSGSGGAIWKLPKDYGIAITLSHSTRLPTAEELYANGPHLATFQFQVGDPTLDEETASGADLSFRRTRGLFTGNITFFEQRFHNYIFLSPTGNFVLVDGEPVPEFIFDHTEARFSGAEAHIDVELLHREPHHLQLEFLGDTLRAENRDSGEPLPFMPPLRYGLGLRYQGEHLWGLVEGRHANRQDRIASFETPTDSYTLLNASVGYRFFARQTVHDVLLRGTNLTDELARNSVSFLKDIMPMPGRDLSLSYRLSF